jgi:hypothetical protein
MSTQNSKPYRLFLPDMPDAAFPRVVGEVLLALALSGFALLLSYGVLHNKAAVDEESRDLLVGAQFRAVMGSAEIVGDIITITEFQANGNERQAIVTINSSFDTEDFSLLTYALSDTPPGMSTDLIWRTAAEPATMYLHPLGRNGAAETTISLAEHPKWRGQVTEIALRLAGQHQAESVSITQLKLQAATWRGALAELWSQWTVHRGWEQSSINALFGTSRSSSTSPTVAMAMWAGLAALTLTCLGLIRKQYYLAAYVAVVLVPWITLDLLWQGELNSQLEETRYDFSGKTSTQKHLADTDSAIYSYARRLKEEVFPASPSRIFILHQDFGHNAQRLKTQYYLLPHNIYNFGRVPPATAVRPGDFILVLGKVPQLRFDSGAGLLTWRRRTLPVSMVDEDPQGTLFQVSPTPVSPGNPVSRRSSRNG